MKKQWFGTALRGMIVGGTMLVPGVSGGTMAMILGVYDKLVHSVSSFRKHKKSSLLFLLLFSLGGGLGMLLFATPLLSLIEAYPMPTLYFFLGAVAGGVPLILKQAKLTAFSWRAPVFLLLGIGCVLLFSLIPANSFDTGMRAGIISFLLLLSAGLIAAVALVLPGISVSYLLLLMGLYDETIRAMSEFYLPYLLPLGLGLLLGILLTTRLLERAMTRHPQPTYLLILGFVLGSLAEVFPGIPHNLKEWLLCPALLCAGFLAIWLLSRGEQRNSAAALANLTANAE